MSIAHFGNVKPHFMDALIAEGDAFQSPSLSESHSRNISRADLPGRHDLEEYSLEQGLDVVDAQAAKDLAQDVHELNHFGEKFSFDADGMRMNTKLHYYTRNVDALEHKLTEVKTDYRDRIATLKKGENAYLKREVRTVTELAKLRAYFNEKEGLRLQANKKAAEERHISSYKHRELVKCEMELENCIEELERVKETLNKNNDPKAYLEKVVASTRDLKGRGERYIEIEDALKRHASLHTTFVDLQEKSRIANEDLRKKQNYFASQLKVLQNNWVKRNAQFGVALKKLEILRSSTHTREANLELDEDRRQRSLRIFTSIELSIRNIYLRSLYYPTHAVPRNEPVRDPLVEQDPRVILQQSLSLEQAQSKSNPNSLHMLKKQQQFTEQDAVEFGHGVVDYLGLLLQQVQQKVTDMKDVADAIGNASGASSFQSGKRSWSLPVLKKVSHKTHSKRDGSNVSSTVNSSRISSSNRLPDLGGRITPSGGSMFEVIPESGPLRKTGLPKAKKAKAKGTPSVRKRRMAKKNDARTLALRDLRRKAETEIVVMFGGMGSASEPVSSRSHSTASRPLSSSSSEEEDEENGLAQL